VKKVLFAGAMMGALVAIGGSANASEPIIIAPSGQEGCVSPPGDTCTYTPTRDGGYVGQGTWTVTVEIPANGDARDTNGDGKLRYVFDSSNAPEQGCGFFAAGSTVTTQAGADGGVAAGNPIPGPSDAIIGDANNCATGMVAADNAAYTPAD
jgi:hypothetical protein